MLMEIRESKDPVYKPDFNFRMVLPRTQKKLQLVIEPTDSDARSETSDSQQDRRKNKNSDLTNAGFRYVLDLTGIKFSTGTGIILGIPTKVFVRFTAKKAIKFSSWTFKIQEELYWVNTEGLSSDLDADFYKNISKNIDFKFVNNIAWDEEDEIIELENGPSLYQTLSDKRGLSYHAHIFTLNKPDLAVSNYLLQITYTQNIWKKWIFANFSPFINFPRENSFHRTPGFNIRLDALFGYF